MHAVHSTAIFTDSGIFRCSGVWRTPKRHSPRVARRRTAARYGAAESAVGRQSATKKPGRVSPSGLGKTIDGGPSGIRTLDLGIKSPLLWPAELTARAMLFYTHPRVHQGMFDQKPPIFTQCTN